MLLTGGRIIDPSQKLDRLADILIENGRISRIYPARASHSTGKSVSRMEVLNLSGLIVTPGLIDMHTHLRDPGFEYKETIETGLGGRGRRWIHLRRLHGQYQSVQ